MARTQTTAETVITAGPATLTVESLRADVVRVRIETADRRLSPRGLAELLMMAAFHLAPAVVEGIVGAAGADHPEVNLGPAGGFIDTARQFVPGLLADLERHLDRDHHWQIP